LLCIYVASTSEFYQTDAAKTFQSASRPDLAEKELKEASLLTGYLPPLMPEVEIDNALTQIIERVHQPTESNPAKNKGKVIKAFYERVDKSLVDPGMVSKRVDALLKVA
jgi:uncharacterized protein